MSTTDPDTEAALAVPLESLWQNHEFVKFWIGESLSLIGTQVTNLALPLAAIYAFHASAADVGVLRFVQFAPYIGFAMLFGVWADRHRRREIMLWTNAVRLALIALVPVLHWYGELNMPLLLIIACTVGVASVMFDVSWMPYVPSIIKDPRNFAEAYAKVGVSWSVATVAGPGIAGVLVAAITAPGALIADAFSYLISIVSLLLIRTPEPRPMSSAKRHVMAEMRAGLHWVFSRPTLRWLAIVGFFNNVSMVSVWTIFLLYGVHKLHFSSAAIGAVFTASAVGGVIGAAITRPVLKRFRLGPVYFIAQTGLLAGPVVIIAAVGPRLLVSGFIIVSFFATYLGLGIANVIVSTTRALTTPQSMMSRMTACFRMVLYGGSAVGGLAGGLFAGWFGDKNALIIVAIGSTAVVVLLIISPVSRLRELPPPVTDLVASPL